MDIFINSDNKLVEISIYKNNDLNQNTDSSRSVSCVTFYDYLTQKEINKLNSYFLDSEYDTHSIYGKLDKNNFSINEIHEDSPEYEQIKMLVSNKFYKKPIDINSIIKDISDHDQTNKTSLLEQIYKDALDSLTAHTITLKNNNYGSTLTENLSDGYYSDNDEDSDNYVEHTIDFNMVNTLINI